MLHSNDYCVIYGLYGGLAMWPFFEVFTYILNCFMLKLLNLLSASLMQLMLTLTVAREVCLHTLSKCVNCFSSIQDTENAS